MPLANEKFGKAYKLCSVKEIEQLFKAGESAYSFPFSCKYALRVKTSTPLFQIVISVPKRNFKKAVDRNRLKRLIREAVRKNKLILETFLEQEESEMSLVLVYTHKKHLTFEEMNDKTRKFLTGLIEDIKNGKSDT